ncbi:hypothetical protein R3W88_015457 [Solanum pinnatisectum]|uniref:Fungal lipase-type domain-containing protein n=1 Tax=Solanum pinnatisectum TaxID=50273 RepID=A0AAV9KUY6_9SOLN|nr:hypothetical protein R3W88_015457 [Solanum pinnatisectum]
MGLILPISKCSTLSTKRLGARRFKITSSWNPGFNHCSVGDRAMAKLRDRWMEFQGIKNWEGLLGHLDDDLRKEILRYGKFTFPNLASSRSSWISYVAVCDDAKEIVRLWRRDVVIAYRGTTTSSEWLENFRATLSCLPDNITTPDENYDQPMVQSGLLSLYTTNTQCDQSLQDTIREEISKIVDKYSDEPLSITIAGHSLGAAPATLTACDITTKFSNAPIVSVVSFGGPRVGNKSFQCQLEKSGTNVLRIVNSDDPVTKVPGFVIHDDIDDVAERGTTHVASTRMPSWLQKCMEDTQWVYAEVGKELRLSSKGDIATCHDLKTYLHLVTLVKNVQL